MLAQRMGEPPLTALPSTRLASAARKSPWVAPASFEATATDFTALISPPLPMPVSAPALPLPQPPQPPSPIPPGGTPPQPPPRRRRRTKQVSQFYANGSSASEASPSSSSPASAFERSGSWVVDLSMADAATLELNALRAQLTTANEMLDEARAQNANAQLRLTRLASRTAGENSLFMEGVGGDVLTPLPSERNPARPSMEGEGALFSGEGALFAHPGHDAKSHSGPSRSHAGPSRAGDENKLHDSDPYAAMSGPDWLKANSQGLEREWVKWSGAAAQVFESSTGAVGSQLEASGEAISRSLGAATPVLHRSASFTKEALDRTLQRSASFTKDAIDWSLQATLETTGSAVEAAVPALQRSASFTRDAVQETGSAMVRGWEATTEAVGKAPKGLHRVALAVMSGRAFRWTTHKRLEGDVTSPQLSPSAAQKSPPKRQDFPGSMPSLGEEIALIVGFPGRPAPAPEATGGAANKQTRISAYSPGQLQQGPARSLRSEFDAHGGARDATEAAAGTLSPKASSLPGTPLGRRAGLTKTVSLEQLLEAEDAEKRATAERGAAAMAAMAHKDAEETMTLSAGVLARVERARERTKRQWYLARQRSPRGGSVSGFVPLDIPPDHQLKAIMRRKLESSYGISDESPIVDEPASSSLGGAGSAVPAEVVIDEPLTDAASTRIDQPVVSQPSSTESAADSNHQTAAFAPAPSAVAEPASAAATQTPTTAVPELRSPPPTARQQEMRWLEGEISRSQAAAPPSTSPPTSPKAVPTQGGVVNVGVQADPTQRVLDFSPLSRTWSFSRSASAPLSRPTRPRSPSTSATLARIRVARSRSESPRPSPLTTPAEREATRDAQHVSRPRWWKRSRSEPSLKGKPGRWAMLRSPSKMWGKLHRTSHVPIDYELRT